MSSLLPTIYANHITKIFGKDKVAVDDLSLTVYEGEIYAFLGPNGAGKSTFVKMLITLLEPTKGDGEIFGRSIVKKDKEVRLLIGVALQEASLDEAQTGIEFLRIQAALYGLSSAQTNHRIDELTSLIDIGEALHKPIKTYSGGMKRRLDLAASIIHRPRVLFLDEPTTGLDPISRNKVWAEVNRLNKELNMTIFLTTQYLEEADQLADRVGIISNGKLIVEGTPKELKDSVGEDLIVATLKNPDETKKAQKTLTGFGKVKIDENKVRIVTGDGGKVIGKIALELDKSNIIIESLTLRPTTLDDVFLKVTGNKLQEQNI